MPKTEAYELALLLAHDTSGLHDNGPPLLRLTARPVKLRRDGAVRNFVSGTLDVAPLADLVISAQCDPATPPYGWAVAYRDAFNVDLARCEAMLRTLRRIDRGHRKLNDTRGHPATYASYLTRTGEILGISRFGWRIGRPNPTANTYQWVDATDMARHIDQVVRAFQASQAPRYLCPPGPQGPNGSEGCGEAFTATADEDGGVSCPHCGLYFEPNAGGAFETPRDAAERAR